MKNNNSLNDEKLNVASGGIYNQPTHSVEQLHYDDPEMEKMSQEIYANSLMHGQNMNMASQNQAIDAAVKKHASDQNPYLKKTDTYHANHNL